MEVVAAVPFISNAVAASASRSLPYLLVGASLLVFHLHIPRDQVDVRRLGKVSEDELIGEMRGGRGKILALVAAVLWLAAKCGNRSARAAWVSSSASRPACTGSA